MEDDCSQKILAHDKRSNETAFSISDRVELAIESTREEGHVVDK